MSGRHVSIYLRKYKAMLACDVPSLLVAYMYSDLARWYILYAADSQAAHSGASTAQPRCDYYSGGEGV